MCAGADLPLIAAAEEAISQTVVTDPRETCVAGIPVYDDDTNQVPATWFAGDAGIRRLASQCDGPARGRCHFSPTVVAAHPSPPHRPASRAIPSRFWASQRTMD